MDVLTIVQCIRSPLSAVLHLVLPMLGLGPLGVFVPYIGTAHTTLSAIWRLVLLKLHLARSHPRNDVH